MQRCWWTLILFVLIALPLLLWGCDRLRTIYWVGHTDLEVEFVVTDAANGSPIPQARIEVYSEGDSYSEDSEREFALATGQDGRVIKECLSSMCSGKESGLRFTDTFAVHLPGWTFRGVAEGYEPGEWRGLATRESVRQVQRVDSDKAKLVVPVSLRRAFPVP